MSWTLVVVLAIGSDYYGTPPPVGITSYTVQGFNSEKMCQTAANKAIKDITPEDFRNSRIQIKADCLKID